MVSHFVVVMVLTAPPLEPLVSPDEFTARGLVTFAPSLSKRPRPSLIQSRDIRPKRMTALRI